MNLNRDHWIKIALIAGGTAALYWALNNLDELGVLLSTFLGLLSPFLVGGAIAFILNVPMRMLERVLFRPSKKTGKTPLPRLKRPVCMLLSMVLVVAALTFVVFRLVDVVITMRDAAPGFIRAVQEWGVDLANRYPEVSAFFQNFSTDYPEVVEFLQGIDWKSVLENVFHFLRDGAGSVVNSTVGIIGSVFSGATSFFLGFFFACYLLAQKERLGVQFKKLLYAHLKSQHADEVVRVAKLANKTFSSFITGQCVEAVILGLMFWVTMSILRMPYTGTISALIGFTALIPIFGAWIGMALGVLLILIDNPIQALWFAILFLVLQPLGGYLIYPRVVGSSVGLPGIWVLAAVTIGGSAFGIVGMLLMVPLASVLYALVRERTGKQLRNKHIPPEKYEKDV